MYTNKKEMLYIYFKFELLMFNKVYVYFLFKVSFFDKLMHVFKQSTHKINTA